MVICRSCKREIPDDAIYCCYCRIAQKRKPLDHRRRPNGTGSVYKLSGNRERPWTVVITKSNQKPIYAGYYKSKTEAIIAASRLSDQNVTERYNDTVEDVYNAWGKIHLEGLTDNGSEGYKAAWAYFSDIKSIKMRDVKTDVLQMAIDSATSKSKSRAVCEKIKQLSSQLCKYAMQHDIINKNYAQFLNLPKQAKKEKEIFSDKEIAVLFNHKADNDVKIILALIYTGFRIDELLSVETDNVHIDEGYIVGGEKSEAGRNRIVPINDKVLPFIQEWCEDAKDSKRKYLLANSAGNKINPSNFRNRGFYRVLAELKFQPAIDKDHPASKFARLTPHSTRHTFASMAVKAGVKPEVLQKLMGHADYSTTADVYVHDDLQQLKDGVSKM